VKIPPRNIDAFVKKPSPETLAVLVYGPDEGLVRERAGILAKSVGGGDDPFGAPELTGEQIADDPARLTDEARAISMLGGRRAVRVRDASDKAASAIKDALAQIKPGDNFIVVAAGELGPRSALRLLFENADNATAIPCYVDDERDISRVIAEALKGAGWRVSSDALSYMAANVVGDRAVARGEVEKLITYMGKEKREISLDDVSACVGQAASLPLEDLARHALSGLFAEADRVLRLALSEGAPAVSVLRALQNYALRLHITRARMEKGEGAETAVSRLKPPLFFKHKPAFEAQVSNLSLAAIEQILNVIVSAEARCKQTGAEPEIIAGRAVLSVCQIAGKAMRRRA
jgi:DNA polymerase-3 subunit delta